MSRVTFYAVDAPSGAIGLNGTIAHGWWVREGNRIYLPANALGEEWLVRHEMLHALLQRGSHPNAKFVEACHLASAEVWRDSTLRADPANPRAADAKASRRTAALPPAAVRSLRLDQPKIHQAHLPARRRVCHTGSVTMFAVGRSVRW